MTLIEDPGASLVEAMGASDVLVSDFSRAAFQYLMFDKPLLLLDCSNDTSSNSGLTDEQRSVLSNVSQVISSSELLASAMDTLFGQSGHSAEQQARVRATVFGAYADGKASHRVATHLAKQVSQ